MVGVRNPMPGVVYAPHQDLERYAAAGLFADETLGEAITALAKCFPERVALSHGDRLLTFRELDGRTDRIAAGLLAAGLKPLDRAVFQIANSIELVVCLVACLKAGIIPLATLTAHRRAEIGYLARHAKARAHFICSDDPKFDFVAFAREMRVEASSFAITVVARGDAPADASFVGLNELEANGEQHLSRLSSVEHDPYQVAIFQLSGGTSGIPKIIPRFHYEYLYQIRTLAGWHRLNETSVGFSPAPMMHNAPIICYWGSVLWSGGEVVCGAANDLAAMARAISTRRPNWMSIPLPLLLSLKTAGLIDEAVFGQARMLTANHVRRVNQLTGATVFPLYGMTEGIISCGRAGDLEALLESSVGRPISPLDEFYIADPENGQRLPAGELGEFCFKGPSSSRGYYDAADRNAEAFTRDGFCKSGDLMRIHEVGGVRYVSFEGRVKDVVSRGGEKINCQEVERVLIDHPAVGAIAIVPMPDPIYSERACAFVIPSRNAIAPTVHELGKFLEGAGLAKFKWPERVEPVAEFPMTSSGKVSKPKLREIIAEKLKAEASQVARSA